jgi:hypothetical protein
MKDKKLRELLDEEGFIYSCPHSGIVTQKTIGLKDRIRYLEKVVDDQQEQIDFILNHLNLDIEKFKGYVEKKA